MPWRPPNFPFTCVPTFTAADIPASHATYRNISRPADLLASTSGDATVGGQIGDERHDLRLDELRGMPQAAISDVSANPPDVCQLCTRAHVPCTHRAPHAAEEIGL